MAANRSNPTTEGSADAVEAVLDSVIVTELLNQRPSRPPNHAAENDALSVLVQAMAEAPHTVLQKLVDAAVELTGAGSAGVSVLEASGGKGVFRWWATAGAFFPFAQNTLPRDFSPCGVVLDRDAPQLMREPARFYPYISGLRPEVSEVLLVPFYRGTTPVGTVWIVAHSEDKHFDAEDRRIVTSLSKFASAATQMIRDMEAVDAANCTLEAEAAECDRAERSRDALLSEVERQAHVFDTVLTHINDFAYVFDRDGRFVYVNKPLLDLWGLPLVQAVGKNFFDLKYPDDLAAQLQRQIQQVIDTKLVVVDETPYTSPSGKAGYYEYIFSPVFAPDGSVEVVAGSTRVITARKQLEVALRNERARLASVIEQAPAFICTLRGPDHVFELANERYYEIVGKREIIGKSVREALPEVEGQGFFELLDNVYRTGETFTGDEMPVLLRRKDDASLDQRFMNLVYQPLREADGTISGIFVHGVDVTEMIGSREAVRQSEARFRAIADAMPQMVWVTRPDGYHEFYNKRWYEFTGVPEGSTDGDGWNGRFHPEDQDRAWAAWRHSLATGEPYQIEYRLRHRSGAYRWTLGRALPLRNDRGEIERWYGTCTDIDDQKQFQTQRERLLNLERQARAEAETANRAKDHFLAVLSHELRTPLTPVAMAATAMEMDPALPFQFREDVAMIRRNVELETRLIDDLLDLSRVTSGKLRLNKQPTHVHEVVRHVLRTVGAELHEKQLRVEQELVAAHDRVDADPARLQQTLWNLLKNAAKFTPAGGRVVVRTRNADDRVIVEVADTGKGIAPEALPHVFEPFEQGDAGVTRQFGGMGLGLAIAKAVVDLHAGTITATSNGVGHGAVFTVTLPLGRAVAPADPDRAQDCEEGEDRPVRLLLVEDHADSAKILVRLLRQEGTEVQWAGTVAAALELAASEPFDVVVSDLGLPDGTGYHLMRELRRARPVKGIAMSGYGMEDDVRQSREAGFAEHLVKPVDLSQLRDAIRRVVRN